jgi:hypothetical protein
MYPDATGVDRTDRPSNTGLSNRNRTAPQQSPRAEWSHVRANRLNPRHRPRECSCVRFDERQPLHTRLPAQQVTKRFCQRSPRQASPLIKQKPILN